MSLLYFMLISIIRELLDNEDEILDEDEISFGLVFHILYSFQGTLCRCIFQCVRKLMVKIKIKLISNKIKIMTGLWLYSHRRNSIVVKNNYFGLPSYIMITLNFLSPNNAIWRKKQIIGSTLDQVMAYGCLTAWNYYLNQWWLFISAVQWHSPKIISQEML